MSDAITVTGETSLSNSFLGDTVQICVVTTDIYRTLDGFVKLGIGPWRIYTFGPATVTEQTYRGKKQTYSMRLAVGYTGSTFWEVIEPLEGESIYKDFLAAHGEGIQHVAQGCGKLTLAEQIVPAEPVIRRGRVTLPASPSLDDWIDLERLERHRLPMSAS